MASKRDLVEAHAFNRRRLVTAFVSGAPGGRELEPARPMAAVWVSLALAVLVVAGSAIAGYLRPGLPSGWDQNTLVVARSSGARYLATNGLLYPVANTTSARLLIPPEDFRVVLAPDDRIESLRRGDSVGIVGAPDALPAPERLVQSGWSSCLDRQGRARLRIAASAAVEPAPANSAFVVSSGPELVVISGANRFRVTAQARAATLRALQLDAQQPIVAPGTWADLFPAGPTLGPLTLTYAGQPLRGGAQGPGGASTYGTILQVLDPGGDERLYVLTPGGLAPLSPVAAALYEISPSRRLVGPVVRVSAAEVASLPTVQPEWPAEWPQEVPVPLLEPVTCALLTTEEGQLPEVELALPSDDAALPTSPVETVVEPGRGALVRGVSGGIVNLGTVFLVDATGSRYALGAPVEEVQARLGYRDTFPAAIPVPWLDALRDGPILSAEAAQQVISAGGGG